MKKWFEIKAQKIGGDSGAEPMRAEGWDGSAQSDVYLVSIHDEIGMWGITAKEFLDEFMLIPAGAKIELSINSIGGSVFDGLAIYHAIKSRSADVTAHVVGYACSIATIILMGAGKILMPKNAYLMIHGISGGVWGTHDEMQDYVDTVAKLNGTMRSIYVQRTGADEAVVDGWMSKDTYFDGADAMAAALVDEVSDEIKMAACGSVDLLARFNTAPESFKAMFSAEGVVAPVEPTESIVSDDTPAENLSDDAQARLQAVQACLTANEPKLAQVVASADFDLSGLSARLERAAGIRALAAVGHYPQDKTDELITSDATIASAQSVITQFVQSASPVISGVQVDGNEYRLPSASAQKTDAQAVDTAKVYAQRKQSQRK